MKDTYKKLKTMPVNIYWFSGSGNTLLIAREIRDCLSENGCRVKLIPIEKTDPSDVDTKTVIGFVIPVAGQSTFPFLWEWFEKLPETSGKTPCFFTDTMGIYSGGILWPVKRILKKKGYFPFAAKEIVMPNNILRKKGKPEKDKIKVEKGKIKARNFCRSLLAGTGRWIDIPGYSNLMSLFYRKRSMVNLAKSAFPYNIDHEKCTRCGICVRLCPEKALTIIDDKLTRSGRCSLCTRCFQFCPADAVNIGNGKIAKYSAVSLKELLTYINEKKEN